MAQDFMRGFIEEHLSREERKRIVAALRRMGLRDDPVEWETPLSWGLLEWFVSFAQRDIQALTDAQCDELDEEIQTIQILVSFDLNPWVPTREELQGLAKRICWFLSDLVERGWVRIGPLPVEFVVWIGTEKQGDIPEAQQAKGAVRYEGWGPALIGRPPAEGFALQVPPFGMDGLIHCLAQLLSKYPGAVRRCPQCKKLFAPFRSSTKHCSRTCQSRAWASEQYKKKKDKKKEERAARKKMVPKAKGRGHGTKKRTR